MPPPLLIASLLFCASPVFLAIGLHLQARRLHQRNQAKAAFWQSLESQWEPLLLDYIRAELPPEQIWAQVEARHELYFIDYLMRTALNYPPGREAFQILARPFLPALTARLTAQRGDAEQRARAVQTLTLLGNSEQHGVLLQTLEDPAPLVTLLAALALSQARLHRAAPAILNQLPRLADWHLGLLSQLLSRMGPDVAPLILNYLESADNPEAQTVCLQVLTTQNHAPGVQAAVRLLSDSDKVNVQVAALNLLGQLGQAEHLPLIRSHYHSPYFAVRLAVIRALYRQQHPEDTALFQQAFEDSSHWVAMQAAQALKATGQEHVLHEIRFMQHPRAKLANQVLNTLDDLQTLAQAVQNEEFKHQVGMLFQKFKQQNSRDVQQMITRIFFQPQTHPEVRYAMARELARFRNYQFFYQTLSAFILGFSDQRSLIRALHSFANPESVPALMDYYRNSASWEEKIEIVDALGDIESMESLAFLSKVYNELHENADQAGPPEQVAQLQTHLAEALARKMRI